MEAWRLAGLEAWRLGASEPWRLAGTTVLEAGRVAGPTGPCQNRFSRKPRGVQKPRTGNRGGTQSEARQSPQF